MYTQKTYCLGLLTNMPSGPQFCKAWCRKDVKKSLIKILGFWSSIQSMKLISNLKFPFFFQGRKGQCSSKKNSAWEIPHTKSLVQTREPSSQSCWIWGRTWWSWKKRNQETSVSIHCCSFALLHCMFLFILVFRTYFFKMGLLEGPWIALKGVIFKLERETCRWALKSSKLLGIFILCESWNSVLAICFLKILQGGLTISIDHNQIFKSCNL